MVKISGNKKHSSRLARSPSEVEREIGRALFKAGNLIETHARLSITEGSVSGALHVPSLPGEPPNADTHLLDTSIATRLVGPLNVEVGVGAPYGANLEFGTSKMAPRPFMRPAVKAKRSEIEKLLSSAVSIAVRRT